MSYFHQNEFNRITREHEQVVALLSKLAQKGRKGNLPGFPSFDPEGIESAVSTANDAFALLLIATSEGFIRAYLDSLGKLPAGKPGLDTLTNKVRKDFNKTDPKIPIRTIDVRKIHDLRELRNRYAHGVGSSVFPTVGRVATILGRFFAHLP